VFMSYPFRLDMVSFLLGLKGPGDCLVGPGPLGMHRVCMPHQVTLVCISVTRVSLPLR
jgi:hypothetical protein